MILIRAACAERARWEPSQLERELAAFSTSADRHDLEAAFARFPDDATDELRTILANQAMAT